PPRHTLLVEILAKPTLGTVLKSNVSETVCSQSASLTVSEYLPGADTIMLCVVSPVDQKLLIAELDVSVTGPVHVLPVISNEGFGCGIYPADINISFIDCSRSSRKPVIGYTVLFAGSAWLGIIIAKSGIALS